MATHHLDINNRDVGQTQFEHSLRVGDRLVINAKENPSTGYIWNIQIADGSSAVVVESENFNRNNAAEGMCGVGGQKVITLLAQSAGDARLQMVHDRPWMFKGFDNPDIATENPAGFLEVRMNVTD